MRTRLVLDTARLRLTALTAGALDAWLRGDAAALLAETGVQFDLPVEAPPLFEEDLPAFHRRMLEDPASLGWWVWLASTRDTGRAVGVCGLGGRPWDGRAVLGYAVYPEVEGRGYATEAAGALVAWALGQPGVVAVRAHVPCWNAASLAVARKLGMIEVGREIDRDVGEVAVYQVPVGGVPAPPRTSSVRSLLDGS